MADLITRLLLNTQQFDQNLGTSSKQIQGFQQKINSFSSGAIGAFSKLAGGVGLAIGGMEAFNMAISSTQTTGDTFAITIGTAKDSIDVFFRSLVSGDWTPFQNGIAATYANLKEFQLLLDELDDKKLSLGYIKAEDTRDLARFEEIAKDTTRSYEDRINAVQNYEGVVNHLNKRTQETINLEMKALNTRYSAKSGLKIGDSDLKYFVKNTNFSGELTSEASSKYKEYIRLKNEADKLARSAEYDAKQNGYNPSKGIQKEYADKLRVLELYRKENEFLIKQGWLAEEGDEGRKSTFETLKQQLQVEEEIYRQQIKADKLRRTVTKGDTDDILLKSSKGSKSNKTTVNPSSGSIAYDQKSLAELKKKFENETNEGVRAGLRKAIELEEIKLKIKIDGFNLEELKSNGIKSTGKSIKGDLANGNIKIKGVDPSVIESNYSYSDSLNTVATQLNTITNLTGEGAAAWVNWASTLMTSIATAIPMIAALTTAKKAEANANAEAAITGVGSSVAAIPILGPIMAVAAIGSIIAAFASIPKFASGGIIGGSSFIGDNMIARVNSGEMILNGTQQRNLFNLLDGKGNVAGSSGEVVFKMSGKDLVGVLNNQMSKTNKYK